MSPSSLSKRTRDQVVDRSDSATTPTTAAQKKAAEKKTKETPAKKVMVGFLAFGPVFNSTLESSGVHRLPTLATNASVLASGGSVLVGSGVGAGGSIGGEMTSRPKCEHKCLFFFLFLSFSFFFFLFPPLRL